MVYWTFDIRSYEGGNRRLPKASKVQWFKHVVMSERDAGEKPTCPVGKHRHPSAC